MKFPGNKFPLDKQPGPERSGPEIIELSANDWRELKELRVQALTESPRSFGETVEEARARGESEWRERLSTGRYFCVRSEGRLVAMLCVVREKGEKVSHVMNVYSVYVSPDARNKGLGKALMDRVLAEAAADGVTRKLRLAVAADNEDAIRLYRGMGFHKVADYKDELLVAGEYVDQIGMEKLIS